ncbi:MAG: hypothetical protein IJL52_02825 [Clostridia bacterium]|nr:hypothetical protein [Clostridia bacterium]
MPDWFAKKYRVDTGKDKAAFRGAKDRYRAGAKVTLTYGLIATDTEYTFLLDGQRILPDYDDRKGFILRFTMPAHNVQLSVQSRNITVCQPPEHETPQPADTLTFHSFDGGGPRFTVTAADPALLSWTCKRAYGKPCFRRGNGAGYDVIYTFKGNAPGKTRVTVSARSPIAENFEAVYAAEVDADLRVSLTLLKRTDIQK